MKDLKLEQANPAATPCNVDKKNENTAGSNGSKEEKQLEQGQRQIEHDWDDAGDGEDENKLQMTNDERDDTNDSHALTGGDITKCRALVARISYLPQNRPDLKFVATQVFAKASPSVSDLERVKKIGKYLVGKPREECLFRWQQTDELEAYPDADWGGDKATRRSVSAGVIMRSGHCLKVDQEAAGGVTVRCCK